MCLTYLLPQVRSLTIGLFPYHKGLAPPQGNLLNLRSTLRQYAWRKQKTITSTYQLQNKSNTHDTNFYKNTSHGDVVSERRGRERRSSGLAKCCQNILRVTAIISSHFQLFQVIVSILLHGPMATGVLSRRCDH